MRARTDKPAAGLDGDPSKARPSGMLHIPDLPRPRPERLTLAGQYVRLEPINAARHYASLLATTSQPGEEERFRYLFDESPTPETLSSWFAAMEPSDDPMFHALVDPATGLCGGRQSLMRVVPQHGVIEIGSIYWGPQVARTRRATEALYLYANYVFSELGYRRFEWKCDALNAPSRTAAKRFGFKFEGVFEQHMVVKGRNRDTAWFAMQDHDWPRLKARYEAWLAPENFDAAGQQRTRLVTAET